ncbi:hypothetical protein AO742_27315, partial [Pseudomonas citronellolis]
MPPFIEHLRRIPWRRLFPSVTLVRGEAYAREGRIQITRLTERTLDSVCDGSGSNRYRQRRRAMLAVEADRAIALAVEGVAAGGKADALAVTIAA